MLMKYAYKLLPLKGEISARKSILPFKYTKVKRGDYVLGRPTMQGCPVQHVLEVIEQEKSGIITGWVVGPKFSRGEKVIDVGDYSVIRFEGIAQGKPVWGKRQSFLPGYCMMDFVHSGIVNFISGNIVKTEGILML
jgi:uncharacterized Fe-S cluster-containing protein